MRHKWLPVRLVILATAFLSLVAPCTAQERLFEEEMRDAVRFSRALNGYRLARQEMPRKLTGRYKLSLCVSSPGHVWLRFEQEDTRQVVTVSRYQTLAGGRFDWKRFRYRVAPVVQPGLWMNRELGAESRIARGHHILLSTRVTDPQIFHGRYHGFGHGNIVNNCATYCRDAWEFYTGERYEFRGLHTPIELRNEVIRRHPEVLEQQGQFPPET